MRQKRLRTTGLGDQKKNVGLRHYSIRFGRRSGIAAAAWSAARVRGRKRLGLANNGNKVTPWWNLKVNDTIHAKKVAYKEWLQNKSDSTPLCIGGTLRRGTSAVLTVKKFKMQSWKHFGLKLDSNYWQANKLFWQTIQRLPGEGSHTARSIKEQNGVLLSNEKDILDRRREYFNDFLNPVTITLRAAGTSVGQGGQ